MPTPPTGNDQMGNGQMMHQMVFGFNGSPPASPTKGYLQFMHMGMPPQGSPPQMPTQAPHMQMYGHMYTAAGNSMPNLVAVPIAQHNAGILQPEYQMQPAFVSVPCFPATLLLKLLRLCSLSLCDK